jgi:hypothetical protein
MERVLTESHTYLDECEVALMLISLTLSRELSISGLPLKIAALSNGKTADSGQSSGFPVLRALLPLLPSVEKIMIRKDA